MDPLLKYWSWLGSVRQWHWVSSALCLVGMLLFAFTGITLNHAGQIEASPRVMSHETLIPEDLLTQLREYPEAPDFDPEQPLPNSLVGWLEDELATKLRGKPAEWDASEIYLALPRPGGDAWLSIDLGTGELFYESTSRGWISYLNDLHKGRNTGAAWSWFIDIFSGACIVFSVSGLILLQRHSAARPTTWPVVGLGFLVPVLLALLFIH